MELDLPNTDVYSEISRFPLWLMERNKLSVGITVLQKKASKLTRESWASNSEMPPP